MKETPILYSAEMVRAYLAGRKTQTRRLVKPQPDEIINGTPRRILIFRTIGSPYGLRGDVLWGRETWRTRICWNDIRPSNLPCVHEEGFEEASWPWYREQHIEYIADDGDPSVSKVLHGKTRVSIHMPRWASRIRQVLTEVRVERLGEVSEEDAKAEGAMFHDGGGTGHSGWRYDQSHAFVYPNCRQAYAHLWERVHGKGAWERDKEKWVWVLCFEAFKP